MEKFFSDFFLTEPTIYTLFGSKPMSEIPVYYASKEEWFAEYTKIIQDYPEKEKQKGLSRLKKYIDGYDLPKNWEKWVSWSAKNLDRSFLFAKRATKSEDLFCIYVLNVQEAAWILQKHYSLICRELDMEFDPLQVVLEFNDLNSLFWTKVFNSHYVRGILHGFGVRNSYFFDRAVAIQEKNNFDLFTHPLFKSAIDQKDEEKDFPLPHFRSFSSDLKQDPIYQKYQKERGRIRKILKGRNQFEAILNQLGYQAHPEDAEIAFN